MKLSRLGAILPALGLAAALPLATSCGATYAEGGYYDGGYVTVAPPAPLVEVEGTAPGPDYLWIHGYHRWGGSAYSWTPGHWERRPREGAVWVDGTWEHSDQGYRYRRGYWR